MAEEASDDLSADDWAAAMAEQQAAEPKPEVKPAAVFQELSPGAATPEGQKRIEMILDIPITVTVELGRTKVPIRNILQLSQGSVVELDAMAGEPMNVLVNGCLIAQGEVVVVNDKFGIRLTDIITPEDRLRGVTK